MGLIKKGSRQITINRVVYRWRYPRKPNQNHEDGYPGIIVTVQRLDCEYGSILAINFERIHMNACYFEPEFSKPILPSEVALCIREAIKAGWKSQKSGKQFMLNAKEHWFAGIAR